LSEFHHDFYFTYCHTLQSIVRSHNTIVGHSVESTASFITMVRRPPFINGFIVEFRPRQAILTGIAIQNLYPRT